MTTGSAIAPRPDATGQTTGHRPLITGLGVVLLLTLPALLPLLRAGFFVSDDGLFHVYRTAALARAWQDGVLWPRLFPEFGFGYGQAVLNFYAPLSYAPAAALSVLGIEPASAVKLLIAFCTLTAALAAFGYGRHLFGNTGGVLAAVVYTYAPYHLADAYLRGAVPEYAAFIFPPLILWAYSAAFRRDNPWPALLWGTLAWAGLVLTHNLTALMMAPVAAAQLLVLAAVTGKWRRLAGAAESLLLAVAITAVYWLPVLAESGAVGLGLGPSRGYADHMLTASTLLRRSLSYFAGASEVLGRIYPLSWFALALVGLVALLLLVRWRQRQLPDRWTDAVFHVGVALAAMVMTTVVALPLWDLLKPLLGNLQYPWRFLLVEAVGLMGAAAALPALLPKVRPAYLIAATAALAMLVALPGLRVEPLPLSPADQWLPDRMWQEDAAAGQVGATWTGEFLPVWVTEERWAIGREPTQPYPPAEPVALAAQPMWPRLQQFNYQIHNTSASPLIFAQFFYPAWRARVNDAQVELTPHGDLGLSRLDLAPGDRYVTMRWAATPAVWWGRGLATLGWLIVCALLLFGRRRYWPALVVWLLVGGVALLGMSRYTEVRFPLSPIGDGFGVDFGAVRLEAAHVATTAPGSTAPVTLYWTVNAPTDALNAFVHVVDDAGAVVAQHDGPLAGDYMPAARWEPGLTLNRTHPVALPPDLPPGQYMVMAGVYPPGRPDAPLVADGYAGPRILVGTLQVTP